MYSNSMHNNMMRRGNSTLKTVGIVVVALLFVYGLYSYHDLHTRHKRSEEKADRLRQQHDSLSAQLQVVYEQKSRLDKLLQQEKTDHKQSKDDLGAEKRRQEQKFLTEKQELLNRISSINSEHKMLQGQHEELEDTLAQLQEKVRKGEADHKKLLEQYSLEYQQLKQEKDNEIATLRDQIADFNRRNTDLQNKLHAAIQQNQISQGNLAANLPDQQHLAQQWQQQQQQQQQGQHDQYQQKQAAPQQQQQYVQQQVPQQQQAMPQQQQAMPQQQQAVPQQQQHQQELPQQQAPVQGQDLPVQQQQQQQQPVNEERQPIEQQQVMQVAQPGENQKPYYDPKDAKPDHEVPAKKTDENNNNNDDANAHQVAAPQFENNAQKPAKKDSDEHLNDIKDVEDAKNNDNDEDKLVDRGGFNRINQLDRAPFARPIADQPADGAAQQAPQPNLEQNKPNDAMVNNQEHALGRDVRNENEARIEAPVPDNNGQQIDGQPNPQVVNGQDQPQNQLDLPDQGRGQPQDDEYNDRHNPDEKEKDQDDGDQLGNY